MEKIFTEHIFDKGLIPNYIKDFHKSIRKGGQPNWKMDKKELRIRHRKDIQMAIEIHEKMFNFINHQEMHIKNIMLYYYIPIRIAQMNKMEKWKMLSRVWMNQNSPTLLMEYNLVQPFGNYLTISTKAEPMYNLSNPHLNRMYTCMNQNPHIRITTQFITALVGNYKNVHQQLNV